MQVDDFKSLLNEYNDLKKYKENQMKFAEKLQQTINMLQELKELACPTVNIKVGSRSNDKEIKERIEQCLNVMQAGTQITIEYLRNAFPELDDRKYYYLITKLRSYSNVRSARDGNKVRLFMK